MPNMHVSALQRAARLQSEYEVARIRSNREIINGQLGLASLAEAEYHRLFRAEHSNLLIDLVTRITRDRGRYAPVSDWVDELLDGDRPRHFEYLYIQDPPAQRSGPWRSTLWAPARHTGVDF